MSPRLIMHLITAIAVAATIAGCGDDDASRATGSGGTTVTTSSLSKTEFITQANAVCRRESKGLYKRVNAYTAKHRSDELPRKVQLANMIKAVVVPIIEGENDGIRKLGAPAGEEEAIEAILVDREKGAEEAKDMKKAPSAGIVIERYFGAADDKMEAYGLTFC